MFARRFVVSGVGLSGVFGFRLGVWVVWIVFVLLLVVGFVVLEVTGLCFVLYVF